jgi:hypothetical protein
MYSFLGQLFSTILDDLKSRVYAHTIYLSLVLFTPRKKSFFNKLFFIFRTAQKEAASSLRRQLREELSPQQQRQRQ